MNSSSYAWKCRKEKQKEVRIVNSTINKMSENDQLILRITGG